MKSIGLYLLGFLSAAGFALFYVVGYNEGIRQVEMECMFYNKHAVDGTQVIMCHFDPDPMTIKIIDTKIGKKTGNWPVKK